MTQKAEDSSEWWKTAVSVKEFTRISEATLGGIELELARSSQD